MQFEPLGTGRDLFAPLSDEKSLGNEIAGVTVEVSNDVR